LSAVVWQGFEWLGRNIPPANIETIPPVTELHPIVQAKQAELTAAVKKKGITILVTDGFRSVEEQDALYRKGRSDGDQIVTNVKGGASYHNYGLAIDFALRTKDGGVVWDLEYDGNRNGEADWMEVVAVAKELGFTWGGDWDNFRDYPHLQMDFGYSIRDLQRGKRPPAE
jgi:peptidoglycan L-alanyl-D-glutamate endopeptidase CwlK